MKYLIWPLGCQMNKSDAERIEQILQKLNYQKTLNEKEADLIVVVACSIRQSAVDRIYGKFRWWQKKQKRGELITVLTGCVLKHDIKKFQSKFDLIFDIKDLNKLPHYLHQIDIKIPSSYLKIDPVYNSKFQAFVPIITGCNNFCTYCAVPYTRGREKSRPYNDIIKEVKKLVKKNYKEITLIGENVNSYKYNFPKLLEEIARMPGDFWLRFTAPHPKDFSHELIKIMAKYPKICKQINLPVQSGNNTILKKMNRPYTAKQYTDLVKRIKKIIPSISLSTDAIVGFPGETNKQFQDTCKLFKKINYNMAFIAQYSQRPGTPAAKMNNQIDKKIKKTRDVKLTNILKATAKSINKKLISKTVKILVEKYRKDHWLGRTEQMVTVRFNAPLKPNIMGKFINVRIIDADCFALQGTLAKPLRDIS